MFNIEMDFMKICMFNIQIDFIEKYFNNNIRLS